MTNFFEKYVAEVTNNDVRTQTSVIEVLGRTHELLRDETRVPRKGRAIEADADVLSLDASTRPRLAGRFADCRSQCLMVTRLSLEMFQMALSLICWPFILVNE